MAESGKKLSTLINELPSYYQGKISVKCDNSKKAAVLEKLKEKLKNERINTMDGVKIMHEDWWVLIRPSGTEPIYRIYAEAKSEEKLHEIMEKYRKMLEKIIKDIS